MSCQLGSGALMFYNQGNRQWSTGFMTADGNYSTVHVGAERL